MDFNNTEYAKIAESCPEEAGKIMRKCGYRQTSRKFRHIARIDLPEKDIKNMDWATQECYRRCRSVYTIENVPEIIMEFLR